MNSISLPVFPIPISLYNYGKENHKLNIDLITDTLKCFSQVDSIQRSNMGGWHSPSDMETRYDSFDLLKKQIQKSSDEYCDQYGFKKGLKIAKLWANLNQTGDMNVGHHHANSSLTGVYYPVQHIINDDCTFNYKENVSFMPGIWNGKDGGSIYFQDPCYGLKNGLIKTKTPTAFNLDAYYTYPVAGLLIIFPSYLIHTVTPFRKNMKRISISFTAKYK